MRERSDVGKDATLALHRDLLHGPTHAIHPVQVVRILASENDGAVVEPCRSNGADGIRQRHGGSAGARDLPELRPRHVRDPLAVGREGDAEAGTDGPGNRSRVTLVALLDPQLVAARRRVDEDDRRAVGRYRRI